MITSLLLTLVVLLCFWFVHAYVIAGAPFDARIKWVCTSIAAIIAVIVILGIWGLGGI